MSFSWDLSLTDFCHIQHQKNLTWKYYCESQEKNRQQTILKHVLPRLRYAC